MISILLKVVLLASVSTGQIVSLNLKVGEVRRNKQKSEKGNPKKDVRMIS